MTATGFRWALGAWLLTIYGTLGVVRFVVDELRARGWLVLSVASLFVAAAAVAAVAVAKRAARPWRAAVALALVAFVYAALLSTMQSPEERAHLFEYGLVALLAFGAFPAQPSWRRYAIAASFTAAVGWLDEGIQALLPTRYYDLRDVGFNALAGALACAAHYVVMRSSAASSSGVAGS
ncbi:MAG: VanZ family protein [Deltaproteobacteria bacterium]|nr:VanZ family protein [Deltaproteobacteria bacterium]